jgi:hypothetical protein
MPQEGPPGAVALGKGWIVKRQKCANEIAQRERNSRQAPDRSHRPSVVNENSSARANPMRDGARTQTSETHATACRSPGSSKMEAE